MKNARAVAVEALMKQENNGYSNLVLDSVLKNSELSASDKAFASAVFYGTVERQNTLDYCLECYLKGSIGKLDAAVRAILRSGLYQLRYMQVPAAAAVNEAVKLTRTFKKTSAGGLVNAVLRRAGGVDLSRAVFQDEIHRLSVLQSVSPSVAELMLHQYGDEAEAILAGFFEPVPTTIRTNYLKNGADELQAFLQEQGIDAFPGFVPGSFRVTMKGSPAANPGFSQGRFYVQGEPSQIAALTLGARPGEKVVDLCAAPGGKSLALAGLMQNKGVLCSRDAAANRVPLIARAMERCGVTIARVMQGDASVYDPALADADRVLCDVPCSGLGILGKKPDIRYKDLKGLESLYTLQKNILENASKYLKNGGRLVYSTCTINQNENTAVVQEFLRSHSEFRAGELPYVPDGAVLDGVGGMIILPNHCKMDGFYVACLEKKN